MTTIDLSHLTISDQLELLYSEGVYLSKRKAGKKAVILYQFRTVYVEIFYIEYRRQVDRITYTEDVNILEPYLGEIDLGIFNK